MAGGAPWSGGPPPTVKPPRPMSLVDAEALAQACAQAGEHCDSTASVGTLELRLEERVGAEAIEQREQLQLSSGESGETTLWEADGGGVRSLDCAAAAAGRLRTAAKKTARIATPQDRPSPERAQALNRR